MMTEIWNILTSWIDIVLYWQSFVHSWTQASEEQDDHQDDEQDDDLDLEHDDDLDLEHDDDLDLEHIIILD